MNYGDGWKKLPSGLVVRAWVALDMVPPDQREPLVKSVTELVEKIAPLIVFDAICHQKCAAEGRCVVNEQRKRANWN